MLNRIQDLFITSNIYLTFSPKTYVLLFIIKNTAHKRFIKNQRSNRRTHTLITEKIRIKNFEYKFNKNDWL